MKKHVSIFLTLLILFSVLFAVPAQAAQPETAAEMLSSADSGRSLIRAPRATDSDTIGTNRIDNGLTPYDPPCQHRFGYPTPNSNGTKHIYRCTKCGDCYSESHSFGTPTYFGSDLEHVYTCTKCGAKRYAYHHGAVESDFLFHWKCCRDCGYMQMKIEGHNFKFVKREKTIKAWQGAWKVGWLYTYCCVTCGYVDIYFIPVDEEQPKVP